MRTSHTCRGLRVLTCMCRYVHQMEAFIKIQGTQSPLFLVTACEELRLQAEYGMGGEGVDKFINTLPPSTDALMGMVLARIECVPRLLRRTQRHPSHKPSVSNWLSCCLSVVTVCAWACVLTDTI